MKNWIYALAAIYILSPIDLFPELLAGRFGLIDDILLVSALYYWHYFYRPALLKARQNIPGGSAGRGEGEPPDSGRGPEKDPYEVLGLARDASDDDIKHAYRELAKKYHPDKVSHLGEEFKALAHNKFKEIQAAYQALTPKKR